MFVLGIVGIIFSVYNYFRNPQDALEKKQIILDNEVDTKSSILAQKEAESKALLLAQQVEQERCLNEKKFAEFGQRLDGSMALAQNHIHSVDVKVDALTSTVNVMSNEITKLSTIIEERIPKK